MMRKNFSIIWRQLAYAPKRTRSDYALSLNARIKEMELWRIKSEGNMELLTREVKQQKETLNNTINQKITILEKDTNSKFDLLNLRICDLEKNMDTRLDGIDKRLDVMDKRLEQITSFLYRSMSVVIVTLIMSVTLPSLKPLIAKMSTDNRNGNMKEI